MRIGFSLSLCVKDLIKNKVSVDTVDYIIAGTKAETDEQWAELITDYAKLYWDNNILKASLVVAYLRNHNKIRQPRLTGDPPPNIARGIHWEVVGTLKSGSYKVQIGGSLKTRDSEHAHVLGFVKGDWGVGRTYSCRSTHNMGKYTVTHIPSGLAVRSPISLAMGRAMVTELGDRATILWHPEWPVNTLPPRDFLDQVQAIVFDVLNNTRPIRSYLRSARKKNRFSL